MKIGIITFHASDNCGSELQAYALQYILENHFNAEVEIINYRSKKQRDMYSLFVPISRFRDVLRNVLRVFMFPILYKEQKGYRKFWRYYHLSNYEYADSNELQNIDGKYDVIVCGSDQIWNYNAGDYSDSYLLDFVHKSKKVGYAVSMGQAILNNSPKNTEKYKRMIADFSALSVREFKSQPMLQSLSPVPVDICLDPTFLLDSNLYIKMSGNNRLIKEKYIFCYAFTYHKQFCDNVINISNRLGLPVYMMDRKQYYIKRVFMSGIKLTPMAGPEAFLNVFRNAEMIFTTSFHGTAFSVIFQKKFWYLNETGGEGDGRATSLLRQFGLMHRYVTPTQIQEIVDLNEPINFVEVEKKLKELREHSLDYIKNNIITQTGNK